MAWKRNPHLFTDNEEEAYSKVFPQRPEGHEETYSDTPLIGLAAAPSAARRWATATSRASLNARSADTLWTKANGTATTILTRTKSRMPA